MELALAPSSPDLLDPDTIIAVSEDEDGLHAAPVPASRNSSARPANANIDPRRTTLHRIDVPPRADRWSNFKIRLATSEGRRSSASYLVRKMYDWRGYAVAHDAPAAQGVPPPNVITLVASDADRTLATISVGFDSPAGLNVDTLYGGEIDPLRAAGARLCEFTRLAVDRNEHSREVLAMMFHIAYIYAHRIHGCTDLLIEVNPRHVRFYETLLGFEVFGPERVCPRVNAPGVLLRLSLAHAERQIQRYGGHRELASSVRSLYPLGFSPDEEAGICGRLRAMQ